MPLTPLQDVIAVSVLGGTPTEAIAKLKKKLETYPTVRVVSISIMANIVVAGVDLVAVVEAVPNHGATPSGS